MDAQITTSPARIQARQTLQRLWQPGCDFLGTDVAILGGAMSWVSERHLVSAISNAGGFGVIACGAMTPERLSEEIAATKALTTKPFGVNLITMHPDLDKLVSVCLEHAVGHVVLAGGVPTGATIRQVRDGGARVVGFAPALALGKRLVKMGIEALVIEGSEAGGHIGPVSLTVLAQEILPHLQSVPVFVAGGLARGDAILGYLEQGASGAQLGTLFAASSESIAHERFKKAFVRASARDAVTSVQLDERFPVIPVRGLNNAGSRRFLAHQAETLKKFQNEELTREDAQLEIEHFWAGALRRAVIEGDVEEGSVMAGQSVGLVKAVRPVAEILHDLVEQAVDALVARDTRMAQPSLQGNLG
ncbi:NAD(P)H-dependent flavin oxidoreductase [Kozakia baliensis]|uniref:2-nitropropane dioxygenase n=1 Tax=Kozakia baliensis TaxID=153496 RepID=A0A1D8UU66_9PROT|nr:nitronate monooxygenase [Kozakia baliensis]AOX17037.1 2-nitropropane dioxygenase [Kozakia baliensis]AOX19720.1 2-nitropropane dioxygenase [Kozakia baliensis]GBR25123.1 enoyl-ACP reductase [Kozakia baliensis NRIC 0488]GEL63904.1 2-nitropropane dioxygenase [Kozakia baliensis]